jgi:hypothetical protein
MLIRPGSIAGLPAAQASENIARWVLRKSVMT